MAADPPGGPRAPAALPPGVRRYDLGDRARREAAAIAAVERAVREARATCVPALVPQHLTDAEFDLLPEKLEYYGGEGDHPSVLGGPAGGVDLLRVLLKNLGLREAVRLAPREAWLAALRETGEDVAVKEGRG